MPRDLEKARVRQRRHREKAKIAKFGPDSIGKDMRGFNKKRKGGLSPNFTGGISIGENGYARIQVGNDHPLADPNGYAYLHLLVWCSAGKSRPGKGFEIHHDNEVKLDNRLGNLVEKAKSEHISDHMSRWSRDPDTGRIVDQCETSPVSQGVA